MPKSPHDKAAEDRLEAIGQGPMPDNEVRRRQSDRRRTSWTARIEPIRLRERIRAAGPTIRDDLGKQARSGRGRRCTKPLGGPALRDESMYRYDEFDHEFVQARVAEFRDQVERRLAGEITEDQFRPLRLMNGVYLQLHAYMLRIAIPYGTLNARSSCACSATSPANTTRATAISPRARTSSSTGRRCRTSRRSSPISPASRCMPSRPRGNCIRNVTADHFAGAAADEVADPRPYAEILRQWSSVHPEFSFLPRKFKIAVTGAERDRAAIQVHDIGLHLKRERQRASWALPSMSAAARAARRWSPRRSATSCRRRTCSSYCDGDHARLQSLWPPRQQVQGAHQDPRARDRRRGNRPPGRGRVAAI